MKNLLLIAVVCFFIFQSELAFAQRGLIGANALMVDYQGPYDNGFDNFQRYKSGAEIYYQKPLIDHLSLMVPIRFGIGQKSEQRSNFSFAGLDLRGVYTFERAGKPVSPYLSAGLGGVIDSPGDFRTEIPLGGGIVIHLKNQININAGLSYRYGLNAGTSSFQHNIGFQYVFGKKIPKEKPISDIDGDGIPDHLDECPTIAGLPEFNGCPDTDGDGIPDHLDECPNFAGLPEFGGCPDTDGDGIPDHLDECPTVPGPKENNGCPIGDRDGDGIPDDQDECPDVAGLPEFGGCPDTDGDGIPDHLDDCPLVPGPKYLKGCPDSDGDGVPDHLDRCPFLPGPATNMGCPELKKEEKDILDKAMRAVQFDLSSSNLRSESFAVLDQVVSLMKKYDQYSLSIEGHTDITGDASFNQLLSENRAKACREYIINKGISPDRITFRGYGKDKPLFDNATEEGRRLNRRVEFIMAVK